MPDIIAKINGIEELWKAVGCTEQQLSDAQQALEMVFPPEYAAYLREFGCIDFFATEWTGLNVEGNCNVVTMTLQERSINDDFPPKMLALENAGIDGIVITVDESGAVYKVQYDNCEKIYDSISEYLDRCIARKK